MNEEPARRRRTSSRSAAQGAGSSASRSRGKGPKTAELVKGVVLGALALVLIIVIVRHFGADDVMSDAADPGWKSDGVTGDLGRAASELAAQPPAVDAAKAAALDALNQSPLNVGALSLLADAAEAAGDTAASAKYRRLIHEQTRRHIPTMRWLFDQAVASRDFATAASLADAMLRQDYLQPNARYVMATMGTLITDPEARPPIAAILSTSNVWRRAFLELIASRGDIDAFPELLSLVSSSNGPAFTSAWNLYFDRLIKGGESRRAYVVWTGLLPPEEMANLGLLYNGDFESPATGLPFDWTIKTARGMEIVLDGTDPGKGKQSLRVTFGGAPMSFRNMLQTLILDPGNYTLSGMTKTDNLVTDRGLSWGIYCNSLDGNAQLVASPSFSGTSDWKRFTVDFTVPPQYCDYQTIRLELPARIAAERRIQGSIWVDDLAIVAQPMATSAPIAAPPAQ